MKSNIPIILAIDTSCDDTSAAVVQGTTILSNIIASQTQLHKEFGGVFPTVAKQAHKDNIDAVIATALNRAKVTFADLSAIAVTQGPGLAPALEIGITRAQELAHKYGKPLIAVNHLEGHLLSVLATARTKSVTSHQSLVTGKVQSTRYQVPSPISPLPALGMIISGGNSLFVLVRNIGDYEVLGSTLDDAAGECLDKVGRMLNLGYPAAPVIEKFAKLGDKKSFQFPLPMTHTHDFNLSFAGLKTHARYMIETLTKDASLTEQQTYDFCASFQYAVFRHIINKLEKILGKYIINEVWLGGGVAANVTLRSTIRKTLKQSQLKTENRNQETVSGSLIPHSNNYQVPSTKYQVPKLKVPYTKRLCMDNAAMIGIVAGYKYERNEVLNYNTNLERQPRLKIA